MLPYYAIFTFLAFLSLAESQSVKRKQRSLLLSGVWLLLTLFAGLRYNNADWNSYFDFYKNIANGSGEGSADIGFNLICLFLSIFSNSPILMFVVVAGTSVALNLNSFKKYSPFFLICVLYYFVHLYVLKEMIQIRGGLASAICLYSIRFLFNRKYKSFWLFWLLALSIHFSVIVWALVGLVYKYQPSLKTLKWTLFICFAVGLICPLGQFIKLLAVGVDARLGAYIAYGDSEYAAALGIFTKINAIKSLIVGIILLYFHDKMKNISPYFSPLLYAYILGVCWLMLFNDFAIIGGRMSGVLLCVEPVLVSYLTILLSKRTKWFFVSILIVVTYTMLSLNVSPDKISPYQFYF